MPSLMELVERVNKGELIDAEPLEVYEDSPNSAEKFLAHHAHAMLDLRRAQQHLLQSLEAIDYSDQKVLSQFMSISGFLGLTDLRAGPVIRFGSSAIARREYALGIEAIQNGIGFDLMHGGSFTSDRDNCIFVATQYERAAAGINWTNAEGVDWNNKQMRIAYIVSGIGDDDASGRAVRSLARHHDDKRFKVGFYSTECGVRRDRQQFVQSIYAAPSSRRGTATLEMLKREKVAHFLAPTDADTVSAAKELAAQLVKDRVDVAIFDAGQADPIACIVANWNVARTKVNLVRRTPMFCGQVSGAIYFDQPRFEIDREYWQRRNIEAKFILEGMDVEDDLGAAPQRSAYGIPDNAVVLATCGTDLDKTLSDEFVDTLVNILRSHPHVICLLIGEGELSWQKRKFESAGVGKRVGYAGRRKDLPGFLRICDAYLAEFPASSTAGVLAAMSLAKPVLAMRWGEAIQHSQASDLVGPECTVAARDFDAFVERVSKLIRDPALRQRLGKSLKDRVRQHYSFTQTARQIEQFCEQLVQGRCDAPAGGEAQAQAA